MRKNAFRKTKEETVAGRPSKNQQKMSEDDEFFHWDKNSGKYFFSFFLLFVCFVLIWYQIIFKTDKKYSAYEIQLEKLRRFNKN